MGRRPPRDLRAAQFEVGGETLVVISYPEVGANGLTAAEADVIAQVLDGATALAIASARGTSVRTVNKQLEAAYRKLGVHSRAESRGAALTHFFGAQPHGHGDGQVQVWHGH